MCIVTDIELGCTKYNHAQVDLFRHPDADAMFLWPIGLSSGLRPPDLFGRYDGQMDRYEEFQTFKSFHYVKYRIDMLRESGSLHGRAGRYWIDIFYAVRNRLISANRMLPYIHMNAWDSILSDTQLDAGFDALLRSLMSFDPWRGFKFSTYASWAIVRSVNRLTFRCCNRSRQVVSVPNDDLERMFDLCDKPENGEFGWLREALEDPCLKLSDVERSIIVDYFGVGSEDLSRKIRLKDVAAEYGCTHQRIHQIKDRLLVKLRKSVGDIDMACA